MLERLTDAMVQAMFETMPYEITITDANDEVAAWNKHETRLFIRPMSSMGMNFRQCHPEKSLSKVEQIVGEMKDGTRDTARFWIDLPIGPDNKLDPREGKLHKVLIEFFALRDPQGKYLGCMEVTRDIQDIRELEGQKRLLD